VAINDVFARSLPNSTSTAGAPRRLTPARQRDIAAGYIEAFFRYHLADEKVFAPPETSFCGPATWPSP